MAARRKTTATQETPQTGLNLSVRRSEGVKRADRPRQENPTLEAVQASLTEGPLAFDVASQEDAKNVQNLLRRAAQTLNVGLSQSVTANEDGTFTVDFEASAQKRSRKYTADDIRAWAADNGYGELSGPISKDIREHFKVANGYGPSTTEELNNQA